jgi:hypothetical protein
MSASRLAKSNSTCSSVTSHVERQELSLSSVPTLRIQDVSPPASFRTCAGTPRANQYFIQASRIRVRHHAQTRAGWAVTAAARPLSSWRREKSGWLDSCPSYQPRTHDRYGKLSTPLDETCDVREGRKEMAAGVRRRAVVLRLRNGRLLPGAGG